MKIFKRILIGIVILFFLLVGAAILIPIYYKDKIKDEILDLVNKNIDAEVTLSDFQVGIYSEFPDLTLTIKDLKVMGKEEFSGDTLFYAQKLSLVMDIQQYAKVHEIHFLNIDFEDPYINVLVLKDGRANYKITKSDTTIKSDTLKKDTSSFYLDIEKIQVENGRIVYKDNQKGLNVVIEGFNHTAKWDIKKSIFDWETHTLIKEFNIDYNGISYLNKKETELDLILLVDTDKSLFTFKENNIRINHFNFGLEGSIGLKPNGYDLDLKFAARETLFKHIYSLLPGVFIEDLKQIKTDGDVAFEGFVKGTLNNSIGQIPTYHVNVEVKNAMFKYDSLPVPVENINFHLIADNKDGVLDHTIIDLKSFKLKLDDNFINGHVRIEGINSYKIDGEIKANLDLDDLDRIYPLKDLTVTGLVNLDIKTSGIYDKKNKKFPSIDATVSLTNGFVQTKDYPEPLKEIHFLAEVENATGKVEDTRAQVKKFTFTLEDEPFDITGSVSNFDNYAYDFDVKGKIDLAKITKIYPVDGLSLLGTIDVDIDSKGTASDLENKNYTKLTSNGKIEITNFQASGKQLKQPVRITDAVLSFTPAKIILEKFNGFFGRSDISLKGDLSNYYAFITHNDDLIVGDLTLKSDTLNVNEWMSAGNTQASNSDTSQGLSIIEVPKDLDFTFDSDIKYLLYDDMRISDMDGEIRIKNGALSLNETGFNSLGAKFSLSGDYNTVDMRKPFIDFDISIQQLDINKAYREVALIRSLAPAAKDVFGTLSIDYKFKSDLTKDVKPVMKSMEGGGRIRIHEAKIDGMKIMDEISKQSKKDKINDPSLKDFVMDTEIHGTKLVVKPFALKLSDFDAEIQGVNDVSGTVDYVVKVSMLPFEKIKLPFHITGTYDKPKIVLGKAKPVE